MTILMCAQKLTDASLIYCTVPKTKTSKMKKLKNKWKKTKKQTELGAFLARAIPDTICYVSVFGIQHRLLAVRTDCLSSYNFGDSDT